MFFFNKAYNCSRLYTSSAATFCYGWALTFITGYLTDVADKPHSRIRGHFLNKPRKFLFRKSNGFSWEFMFFIQISIHCV